MPDDRTSPEPRLVLYRGVYCIYRYINGKPKRQSLGTADPARAEQWFAEFKAQQERLSRPLKPTIGQIVTAYIEDRAPEISSPQRLKDAWKPLAPFFEYAQPEHATKQACKQYAEERRSQGRSYGTIHYELGMLRSALTWAFEEEWTERPIPVWLPEKPGPRTRRLSREEAQKLLHACPVPHLRLFVTLALTTAARAGALLDLTWDRVDFNRRLIDLHDPQRRVTNKGRSVVPMNDTLCAALEHARAGALTPYVIEWAGERVSSIKKSFARAVEKSGIAPCTPHTLRHTAAVWMAEKGVPMAEIAQYLGHSTSITTERVYARYGPQYLAGAAGALELSGSFEQGRKKLRAVND